MPLDKDYKNFVDRMGSFEDNFDDLFDQSKYGEEVLAHHGILGMHWGHKKSLDMAKASVDASGNIVRETKNIHTSLSKASTAKKVKDPSHLTDADLKAQVKRMNLEQQYATLSAGQISKGKERLTSTLEVAGSALAITSSVLGLALTIKQLKGK